MLHESIPVFLGELNAKNIVLSLEGDRISYSAPAGAISDLEKSLIRSVRPHLIKYFSALNGRMPFEVPSGLRIEPRPSLIQQGWWSWIKDVKKQQKNDRVVLFQEIEGASIDNALSAFQLLFAEHDALRSHYYEENGELCARLNTWNEAPIETIQLGDDAQAIAEARKQASILQDRRIEVRGRWVTSVTLFLRGKTVIAYLLVLHHIIGDAYSVVLLRNRLRSLLRNQATSEKADVTSVFKYAAHEHAWFLSSGGRDTLKYWFDWAREQPDLRCPASKMELRWQPGKVYVYNFLLPISLVRNISELARIHRTSLFIICLAIFGTALSRWFKQASFPVRCVGNLRDTCLLPGAVGNLVCYDAVRIDVSERAAFSETLQKIVSEYQTAVSLRLPTVHRFPMHEGFPEAANHRYTEIATTFNFMPKKVDRSSERIHSAEVWPPHIEHTRTEEWDVKAWPLYLMLAERSEGLYARFQVNDSAVAPEHHLDLAQSIIREFMSVVQSELR
jgi:hypothetical protein